MQFRVGLLLKYWIITVLLCSSYTSLGQPAITSLGEPALPTPEGIAFVSKAKNGFYYFGSTSGLFVFDGKLAKQLMIKDYASPYVHDQMVQSRMYEDSSEKLWFSTYTALHAYEPKAKVFQTFAIERDGNLVQDNYHVFHIDKLNNEIWLKAGQHIWSFNTTTYEPRHIAGPTEGNRFLVSQTQTGEKQIIACPFMYKKGVEVFKLQENEVAAPWQLDIDENVTSAVKVGDRTFLLGLTTGLAELRLKDSIFQIDKVSASNPDHSVWDLCKNETNGTVWVSQTQLGVMVYDPTQRIFLDSIKQEDGLSSNKPNDLFADDEGRLFISQPQNGLDVIEPTKSLITFHPIISKKGISSFSILENNNLLTISQRSLSLLPEASLSEQWVSMRFPKNATLPPYRGKIFNENNRLFIQGLKKLWVYDTINSSWEEFTKKEYPIRGIFISPDSSFLMLSRKGVEICVVEKNRIRTELDSLFSPSGTNDFLGLFQLNDTTFLLPWRSTEVWLGAYSGGKYLLRNRYPVPGEIKATILDQGEGIIYAGGTSGLYAIKGDKTTEIKLIENRNTQLSVESMVRDRAGNLWIGTRNGLYRYSTKDCASVWFSVADGLPSNRFQDNSAILLPSDSILMGTKKGFFSFSPERLKPNTSHLTPYISNLWINDVKVENDSTYSLSKNHLTLPHRKNNLGFQVASLGLHQEGMASIQHQLIGLDHHSSFAEQHSTIHYPNLPPGDYTLQLTAINRNGLPSGRKRLAITINPPFTQTRLFYFLCTCGLALIVAGFYFAGLRRERLKQQRLQEQQARLAAERDRIAGEVHDDLGGQISSILYLSEEMILTGNTSENEYELNRIQELSRSSLQNVRDIIFALDNRRATLSALGEQLRGAGTDFFTDRKIEFTCTDQFSRPDFSLTSRQKRNLTQIVKEAWHNTAKHADAKAVKLALDQASGTLHIVLTDDGKGFTSKQSDKATGGYGLDNMEEKAVAIGASLSITSRPGQGTEVSLTWPLPQEG